MDMCRDSALQTAEVETPSSIATSARGIPTSGRDVASLANLFRAKRACETAGSPSALSISGGVLSVPAPLKGMYIFLAGC